jgi:hypothetical protein
LGLSGDTGVVRFFADQNKIRRVFFRFRGQSGLLPKLIPSRLAVGLTLRCRRGSGARADRRRLAAALPPLRAVLSVSQRKTHGAGEAAVIRYTVQPTSIPQGDIAKMVKKV